MRNATITIGGQIVVVTQRGCEMGLSHNETNIAATAESVSLGVTALEDVNWSVVSGADWIQIEHAGSGIGSSIVDLLISENQSYLSRTGIVAIGTEKFTVAQSGCTDLFLTIDEECVDVPATKTTEKTLKITATPDLPWSVTSNCDWLAPIECYRNGAGTTTIVFSVAANRTLSQQTGKLTITPIAGSGLPAKTLTVVQDAAVAMINSSSTEVTAAQQAVSVSVQVDEVVGWTVTSTTKWITFEGMGVRTGAGNVTLHISENTSLSSREGTVSIAGHTFVVQQAGGAIGISKTNDWVCSEGGSLNVEVSGSDNLNWTIENSTEWVTVEGESLRKGPTTLVIRVDTNANVDARRCELKIGGQNFVIEQAAASTSVESDICVHGSEVEIGSLNVTAPDYLKWGTRTTNDWIILTGDGSATGSGTVEYIVDQIEAKSSRIGVIWVGMTPVYICQCAGVMKFLQTAGISFVV